MGSLDPFIFRLTMDIDQLHEVGHKKRGGEGGEFPPSTIG